ncbi:MAG: hypothetical protein ACRDQB_12365, partial [Thermocrispum sp.]
PLAGSAKGETASAAAKGAGSTPMMPPPMMPPMAGAGRGAGGAGSGPGDGSGPGSPERNRPVRSVPGVPPKLRGKAGTLDATPAFLPPAGRVGRRQAEEPMVETVELLDEELWAVEPAPPERRVAVR